MKELDRLLDDIYKYKRLGIKLGLERIDYITKELGYPQDKFNTIHIGGTNGKGSTCRFINSILREAGYSVGLYTSPHLIHIRERFLVDGKPIADDSLYNILRKILEITKKMNDKPTFFEITTAAAFEYFMKKGIDLGVIEVGLGGRYDATNVIQPKISIITDISLDHTDILGNNIQSIAIEKAGIIKNNIPVVTSAKGKALDVVKKIAKEKKSKIIIVDKKSWKRVDKSDYEQRFIIHGELKDYYVGTHLLGKYQGENISLAVFAIENLQMNGFYISEDSIEKGIEKTNNPGRFEIISKKPYIVLDGAHNPSAMNALVKTILEDFKYDNLIFILGILKDKDVKSIVKIVSRDASVIIATKSNNERACNENKIAEYSKRFNPRCKVVIKTSIREAVEYAKNITKSDDLICITGSLYTVGEAKDALLG